MTRWTSLSLSFSLSLSCVLLMDIQTVFKSCCNLGFFSPLLMTAEKKDSEPDNEPAGDTSVFNGGCDHHVLPGGGDSRPAQ